MFVPVSLYEFYRMFTISDFPRNIGENQGGESVFCGNGLVHKRASFVEKRTGFMQNIHSYFLVCYN